MQSNVTTARYWKVNQKRLKKSRTAQGPQSACDYSGKYRWGQVEGSGMWCTYGRISRSVSTRERSLSFAEREAVAVLLPSQAASAGRARSQHRDGTSHSAVTMSSVTWPPSVQNEWWREERPREQQKWSGARYLDKDTPHLYHIDSSSGKREAEGSVKSNPQSRGRTRAITRLWNPPRGPYLIVSG